MRSKLIPLFLFGRNDVCKTTRANCLSSDDSEHIKELLISTKLNEDNVSIFNTPSVKTAMYVSLLFLLGKIPEGNSHMRVT